MREADEVVAALQAELEEARAENLRLQRAHRDDIAMISQALLHNADRGIWRRDSNWCGEYDSVIESLNHRLHVKLTPRVPTRTPAE